MAVYNSEKDARSAISKTVKSYSGPTCTMVAGYPKRTHFNDSANYEIEAVWACKNSYSHIDKFEIDVEFLSARTGKWEQYGNGLQTCPASSFSYWTVNGKKAKRFIWRFTPAHDLNIRQFRIRVRALSKEHSVTAYYNKVTKDSKGREKVTKTKVTKTVKYFATSAWSTIDSKRGYVTPWDDIRDVRPGKPGVPTARLLTNGKIEVSFDGIDPDSGDTCRLVYREVDGSLALPGASIAGGSHRALDAATKAVDTGVSPGHSYRYYARAHNKHAGATSAGKALDELAGGGLGWCAAPSLPADLSDAVNTPPVQVSNLDVKGYGDGGAKVAFDYPGYAGALAEVKVYYSKDRNALVTNRTSGNQSFAIAAEALAGHMEAVIAGLDAGTWYFAVWLSTGSMDIQRLFCDSVATCAIASAPEPPTLLPIPKALCIGDAVEAGWVHNCEDGSDQTAAELLVTSTKPDGTAYSRTYTATTAQSAAVALPASDIADGAAVSFKARTKGAAASWSDWSGETSCTAYARPVCQLSLGGSAGPAEGEGYEVHRLPLVAQMGVGAEGAELTQQVVQWALSITAIDAFTYQDAYGNDAVMPAGASVCEVTADSYEDGFTQPLMELPVSAAQAVFCNNQSYELTLRALMDSGLEAAPASVRFACAFDTDGLPSPSAMVEPTGDWGARIYPAVTEDREVPEGKGYVIERDILRMAALAIDGPGSYEVAVSYKAGDATESFSAAWDGMDADIDLPTAEWDSIVSVAYAPAGSQERTALEGDAYRSYCQDESILLSVYRIDTDGELATVVEGLPNIPGAIAYDRHPAFGTMAYRVVANDPATDEVSSADVEEDNPQEAVLIQWDEAAASYASSTGDDDSGMNLNFQWVELPFGIDISQDGAKDAALPEYPGRKFPVALYGTQVGERGSWSGELVRDAQRWEISQLRRLSHWMGPCWVRDPSGLNFAAHVNVHIGHKCDSAKVPVSLEVVRVEGD